VDGMGGSGVAPIGPGRARSGLVRSGQVDILDTCLRCITCFRNQTLMTSVIGLLFTTIHKTISEFTDKLCLSSPTITN